MRSSLTPALLLAATLALAPAAQSQQRAASPAGPQAANRAVYLDSSGVVRWRDNRQEMTLFGSNYVIHTASDYRAAGYVGGDRKRMINDDVAHFARMGWDGLRLTFWGDWQSADSAGNLLANDHLDLLDYLIAKARERGIYMLFSPIQLYSANWPDSMQNDPRTPGFGRVFGRQRMGTDAAAIAAQTNYLRQILNHVNPYTGVALKDEPAIVMIELVNEPWHHPEDVPGSIRYLNALTDAVRATGCRKLVFYNISQDFAIGESILRSRVQGITFGWYPTGLNSGRELQGNYLRAVDDFPDMRRPELARLPRIVYEYDSPDLREATMYPAMARTMRSVGGQVSLMFAYDMLGTASRNLGWQTHYLNLVYTPRKAMSTVIAAEIMRRLPRGESYGAYPANTRFGDFRVSHEENLSELVSADAFLHAGTTTATPPNPATLTRLAGVGSSPIVRYEGDGAWFLDKVRDGLWRLEVYPDAVPVRDPFELQSPDKIVTRAISRAWPITVTLPGLGQTFTVERLAGTGPAPAEASGGRFVVTPGVYILSAAGHPGSLPMHVAGLGMSEYHGPPSDTLPLVVTPLTPPELPAGRSAVLRARVVDLEAPDSVTLFLRRTAGDFYRPYVMRRVGGYEYEATVPPAMLRDGPHEYVITVFRGGRPTTFPEGLNKLPWAWDYYGRASWRIDVAGATTPLVLFDPGRDASHLTFTRIGDAGRRGLFSVRHSDVTGAPIFHLELPDSGGGLAHNDYTASLVVQERVAGRQAHLAGAEAIAVRLRGIGARQIVYLTLMERDGTSWSAALELDTAWVERTIPLASFTTTRGVLLPQGFPGQWSYWVGPAAGRGGAGDRLRLEHLERLQISLRRGEGVTVTPGGYGVEVESIVLRFGR